MDPLQSKYRSGVHGACFLLKDDATEVRTFQRNAIKGTLHPLFRPLGEKSLGGTVGVEAVLQILPG